jgi:hypothetical protein
MCLVQQLKIATRSSISLLFSLFSSIFRSTAPVKDQPATRSIVRVEPLSGTMWSTGAVLVGKECG